MKTLLVVLAVLLTFVGPVSAEDVFKSEQEKIGYAIGMNIGFSMKSQGVEVDTAKLSSGLSAAYSDGKTLLSKEEMQQILMAFQQKMQTKQQEKMAAAAEMSIKTGADYRAENAKNEGVVVLKSGLQYKVLTAGNGKSPAADSKVEVHYRGTLMDGKEFDSSYTRGEPVSFPLNGVISGWTEALQLMKEGGKWQLVIPPELAYGERGAPPTIPPNATLIFDVELLKVLE